MLGPEPVLEPEWSGPEPVLEPESSGPEPEWSGPGPVLEPEWSGPEPERLGPERLWPERLWPERSGEAWSLVPALVKAPMSECRMAMIPGLVKTIHRPAACCWAQRR